MKNITQKVDELISASAIDENIALFGINNETFFMMSALRNAGISPKALVALSYNQTELRQKSFAGVEILSLKQYDKKYGRRNKLLLNEDDWFVWRWWLEERGYYKDHRAIVGASLKTEKDDTINKLLSEKWRLKNPINRFIRVKRLQNKLKKKYGNDTPFFCYKYSGLGDCYLIISMLMHMYGKRFVLVCTYPSMKKVAGLFEFKQIEIIDPVLMEDLYIVLRLEDEKDVDSSFKMFTSNPQNPYDILRCVYGPKLTMKNSYENCLGKKPDSTKCFLPKVIADKTIDTYLVKEQFIPGKTVFLNCTSNSAVTYDYYFWNMLSEKLLALGYRIILNHYGNDFEIRGTESCSIDLVKAPYLVEKIGIFIGVRSGFCDCIAHTKAKKIILYPKAEIHNFRAEKNYFEAFSFHKMGMGYDFFEISWPYDKYEALVDKIIDVLEQ